MLEIELGEPIEAVARSLSDCGLAYQIGLALVRLHTQPLGLIEIELTDGGLSSRNYARQIWTALGPEINAHLRQEGLPEVTEVPAGGLPSADPSMALPQRDAPFVTVAVATHNRPEGIARCLRSLLALDYPFYEILVMDNAPSSEATAELIARDFGRLPQVRYMREDRPGGTWARNLGLWEAKGEIVAFIDDDMVADTHWLSRLVAGFKAADNVACVTGMILPIELETPAQVWFEEFGGFNKGFVQRVFDMAGPQPKSLLYPYAAGTFGSGASMAFRVSALRQIGGFDPAIGPGSPGMGGEDLAAFVQVIKHGYRLVYEPTAVAYHLHRRDYSGLRLQMYGYGCGLTAYLTKCVADDPRLLLHFAGRIPYVLFYVLSTRSPKNAKKRADYPRELTRLERRGMIYGPFAYLRGRRLARRLREAALRSGNVI